MNLNLNQFRNKRTKLNPFLQIFAKKNIFFQGKIFSMQHANNDYKYFRSKKLSKLEDGDHFGKYFGVKE